jgi:arylsulfatase A
MQESETTIPALLRDAGYQTCMVGKWHCNSEFNNAVQPQPGDFGFDHWMATQNNAAPSHERPRNFVRNGVEVGEVDAFSCQYVVDEAIRWLEKADAERPFFLYVAFHEPHEPVASPEALVAQYRDVARNEDEAQYFANVANVDDAVGKLVGGLERINRADDTLIIFTSDNGPETLNRYRNANRSYGRPGPLRGMKLHTTDAGFRVAGIIRWRNRIEQAQVGSTYSSPVSSLDFLPTFCRLAGIAPPQDTVLDGTDFSPLFDGQPIARSKPLVWAYYNALNEARVAMRDGNWKVLAKLNHGQLPKMSNVTRETYQQIRDAKLTDIEVYEIVGDLHEDHDLTASRPELGKQLGDKLRSLYSELVAGSHVW